MSLTKLTICHKKISKKHSSINNIKKFQQNTQASTTSKKFQKNTQASTTSKKFNKKTLKHQQNWMAKNGEHSKP
jgi:hypothetical protein